MVNRLSRKELDRRMAALASKRKQLIAELRKKYKTKAAISAAYREARNARAAAFKRMSESRTRKTVREWNELMDTESALCDLFTE